jgi:hypothetical protein
MRLLNNVLSDLKAYARREYSLTKSVPVLVMLITEEEHRKLKDNYDKIVKTYLENVAEEKTVTHCSEEFFLNVASIFELIHNYSSEVPPIVTPMLRETFDILHFGKYKYAIVIREEKLLEWGSQMNIQINGEQAAGKKRKLLIFYRILTQEFLHILESEKDVQIFKSNGRPDSEIVQRALKAVNVFREMDMFSE